MKKKNNWNTLKKYTDDKFTGVFKLKITYICIIVILTKVSGTPGSPFFRLSTWKQNKQHRSETHDKKIKITELIDQSLCNCKCIGLKLNGILNHCVRYRVTDGIGDEPYDRSCERVEYILNRIEFYWNSENRIFGWLIEIEPFDVQITAPGHV